MRPAWVRELLDSLPESALVLDVGGWAEPDPRAGWVIDIGPFETRNWYRTLGAAPESPPPERVTAETWVQADICSTTSWPFADDMFDYVICTQTLEDVRDPVRACEEIARVGKAGYIETPSAASELTRGIESPLFCGRRHHRWLVEAEDGGLVFRAKPHHIHSPFWPAIRSPCLLRPEAAKPLEFAWEGTFTAREEIAIEWDDIDRPLLDIISRSSYPPSRIGIFAREAAERGWLRYRRLRRRVGGVVRR